MSLFDVIRKPIVTEKSTSLAESGKYVFEVAGDASKTRIKEAVETAFSVSVAQVNVMNVRGKMKRFGRKPKQQRSWKKAIVTLREGQNIELFGGA